MKQRKQVLRKKEIYKEALPNGFRSWFQFWLRLAVPVLEFCEIPPYPQINVPFGGGKKLACHVCHQREMTNIKRVP